jgi:hypothetical protein
VKLHGITVLCSLKQDDCRLIGNNTYRSENHT